MNIIVELVILATVLIYCMTGHITSSDDLCTGIVAGIISAITVDILNRIRIYFSDKARFERKRMKACRQAVFNLSDRLGIEIGHTASAWLTPTLTSTHYIWCLFEMMLCLQGTHGRDAYPDEDEYKDAALNWYNEYANANMKDAIEVYSPSKVESIMISVNTWGVAGEPWLYKYCRPLWHVRNQVKKLYYNMRSPESKLCDFLYEGIKLPPYDHTTELMISMITEKQQRNHS